MNCPVKTYLSAMKNSQKKSDQNDRKQILNWIFDESDAEIEGIVCCFAQIENIKRQSLVIGLVKEDNSLFQSFMDGIETLYYSGKQFPTAIALQDLHFFMPYIREHGARDVYEITKMRIVTGKEAKQTDEDNAGTKALSLAFGLRYVRKQYTNLQPIDTTRMIGYTFIDTTVDKLDECVIIDKL